MSLFGALNSGVSGLSAQAAAMGVISDNIANSSTHGYKGTVSRFSTLVTSAATDNSYTPGGVSMHPHTLINQQGLIQSTQNSTAAAISGTGFFIVSAVTNPDTTDERVFTRAGDFYPDKSGNLRNSAGFYLQGWATDRNGNLLDRASRIIANTNNSSTADLQTINIQQTALAAETQIVKLGANLNSDQNLFDKSSLTSTGNAGVPNAGTALIGTGGTSNYPGLAVGNTITINITDSTGTVVNTYTTAPLTATTTLDDLAQDINKNAPNASASVSIEDGKAVLKVTGDIASYDLSLTNGAGGTPATPVNALFSGTTGAGTGTVTDNDGGTKVGESGKRYDFNETNGDMAAGKVKPHNSIAVTVYDKLGTPHDIKMDVLAVGQNRWAFEMHTKDADPASHTNGVIKTGYIIFNNNGTIKDIRDSKDQSLITPGETDASIDIGPVDWSKGEAGDPGNSTIKFDFGEINGNTGLTQNSSGKDKKGNFVYDTYFINQDGASTGDFTGVKIEDDGTVIAAFANGLQRPIYRVAIGTFEAPNELEAATGNVYRETEDSGSFLMRQAGEDGAGKIVPSALEASNVDLATEFTTMIVTQRTYSANSKVITTSDDMLDELLRIKR